MGSSIHLRRLDGGLWMLPPEVLASIERSVLCWLATADADGQPNVSPKEVFAARGDTHLVVANIASPRTVRNVRANPRVCVSFVDVFVQKGYKLTGLADVVLPNDSRFATLAEPLIERAGPRFRILGVIDVEVTAAEAIVAPSYRFVPETTEESQIASAMRSYGVRRLEDT